MTPIKRCQECGRDVVAPGGHVGVRLSDGRAGFSGLATCGSVWSCPVCATKVLARRADELRDLLVGLAALGHSVGMLTLTMRHNRADRLATLWGALGDGWHAATSGRGWEQDRAQWGVAGWVRAVEVTTGPNGWHVHVHALVVYDGPVSVEMGRELAERLWDRWERALGRRCADCGHPARAHHEGDCCARARHREGRDPGSMGRHVSRVEAHDAGCLCRTFRPMTAVRDSGGLDYRASWSAATEWAARYVTKGQAFEVTGGQGKEAKGDNRTPFRLAADVVEQGDAEDLALWEEYCRVSRGKRQMTWSQGLRDLVDLGPELTDEEIAEEDAGSEDLLVLPPLTWRAIRDRPEACELLEVMETRGVVGCRAWLERLGLAYLLPGEEAPPPGSGDLAQREDAEEAPTCPTCGRASALGWEHAQCLRLRREAREESSSHAGVA